MVLSGYHLKHRNRSDEELERRAHVKEMELEQIFAATGFSPSADPVRVAVLGCADRRHVKAHQRIFEKLLKKPVELTTFDIVIEHLKGENHVFLHDCTTPLPNPPYDITFGHVFLKFIETEKQWDVLMHSYEALRAPGIAIHVFDREDVITQTKKQADGFWSVPLKQWEEALNKKKIPYKEIHWELSLENMPIPIRGLKGGALVLLKT